MRLDVGARSAMRTRSQSKKFQGFNKAWTVGDKLSVFFPIFWNTEYDTDGNTVMVQEIDNFSKPVFNEDGTPKMTEAGCWDIVSANIWGHDVGNIKSFMVGGTFIPSLTDIVRGQPVKILRNEDGTPMYDADGELKTEAIPGDITYQFSKIAPLFIKGMKQQEYAKVQAKNFTSEELRRSALNEIDNKYDTQNNMDAPRPVVGKLHMVITTEVVVVPRTVNDGYDVEKAGQYTYKLSDEKIGQLLALLDDNKFKPKDHSARWFEVQMTFNGDDNSSRGRGQAARKAVPVGLTEEYTMEKRDAGSYAKITSRLSNLPEDSATISYRNFMYTKIDEKKISRCIDSYVIMNSEYLDSITNQDDEDLMLSSAARLMQFKVLNNMNNQSIKDKILGAYEEWLAKHPEVKEAKLATEQEGYKEPTFDAAPTVRDLIGDTAAYGIPGEDALNNDDSVYSDDSVTIA